MLHGSSLFDNVLTNGLQDATGSFLELLSDDAVQKFLNLAQRIGDANSQAHDASVGREAVGFAPHLCQLRQQLAWADG
ncbi:hypothetical protein AK812_SmicGene6662 [Symbiodinium microadriaticum]|uniref:Uncharacterized protein n=1 Tax=Symbiodinium microadriaticum TaxID=2951 RepID=A0A1Q9EQH7_SYMMI|nr:hypothetical protein AK812_SmicGene6662 [Symbiodinium microadriaticum]